MIWFNFVSYVFLLLCLCILIVINVVYILFSPCQLALFGCPDWGFSMLFSSVVKQIPGYNSQRRGTARTLPKLMVLFCVLLVCKCVLYYYCHRRSTQLQLTNISIYLWIITVYFASVVLSSFFFVINLLRRWYEFRENVFNKNVYFEKIFITFSKRFTTQREFDLKS